ncbi:MAG TPA: CoA pyrophosphatase [Methylomirabilota bacterium]|nr:CoA pyrophosphatase [Methylomirabilota bacterium]
MAVSDPAHRLSRGGLRARLAAVLAGGRRTLPPGERARAAVLVLFVFRGAEPALVFAKKTDAVPHHKGQFAFPGGIVRASDASVTEAALREAREEIGLDPGAVEVVGLFHDFPTGATNFVITPVVAVAGGTPAFRPDGREIERVLEVPVAELLAPGCFREEHWEHEGTSRPVAFFSCGEDVIWGATGRIVRELLDALFPGAPEVA